MFKPTKPVTSTIITKILLSRPPPKQIRNLINRRRHQPNSRLIRRLIRRTRVRARRDEDLSPLKPLGQRLTLGLRQRVLQLRQVGEFFLLDVLEEVFH